MLLWQQWARPDKKTCVSSSVLFFSGFINFFHGNGVCTAIIYRVFEFLVSDNCLSIYSILTISSAETDQNNRKSESPVKFSLNGTPRSSIVFYSALENFLVNSKGKTVTAQKKYQRSHYTSMATIKMFSKCDHNVLKLRWANSCRITCKPLFSRQVKR